MSGVITKFFFWFSVIVLVFLPGGIFVSVFLLVLYYMGPAFFANKNECTIKFTVEDSQTNPAKMNQYDSDTLEKMR